MNGQTNASFWAVKTNKGNLLLCHIMLHYITPAPGLCCYILPYFHINSQMNSILINFNLTNNAKKKKTDFPRNTFQIFTHDSDDDDNDGVNNNDNDDDDDNSNNNNNCNNNINKDGNNDDDDTNEIKNSLHLIILFV